MYVLGIDTTFHTTGLALVDKNNKVKFNKSIDIDFSNQDADRFFNSHIKNLITLLQMVSNKVWDDIDLISVVNKEGAFHSLPIGVVAACILGQTQNKDIVGVDHEIAHLYSTWIERQEKDFKFPIISLSVSGAHSAIYYQKDHEKIKKLTSILWESQKDSFGGIAALFDRFCHQMKIKLRARGFGGPTLSDLAQKGKISNFHELNKIQMVSKNNGDILISRCGEVFKEIHLNYKKKLHQKEFQQNLSLNFLNHIFEILSQGLLKFAKSTKSKEMHLVGGVSANSIFQEMIKGTAIKNGMDFKAPLKKEYCGDNAAMVAVRGKYKSIFTKKQKFLPVFPSSWYYKYYCKNIHESCKSK